MEHIKFGTKIQHKKDSTINGELTALRGGLNILRVNKLVELDDIPTNYQLREFELKY